MLPNVWFPLICPLILGCLRKREDSEQSSKLWSLLLWPRNAHLCQVNPLGVLVEFPNCWRISFRREQNHGFHLDIRWAHIKGFISSLSRASGDVTAGSKENAKDKDIDRSGIWKGFVSEYRAGCFHLGGGSLLYWTELICMSVDNSCFHYHWFSTH